MAAHESAAPHRPTVVDRNLLRLVILVSTPFGLIHFGPVSEKFDAAFNPSYNGSRRPCSAILLREFFAVDEERPNRHLDNNACNPLRWSHIVGQFGGTVKVYSGVW